MRSEIMFTAVIDRRSSLLQSKHPKHSLRIGHDGCEDDRGYAKVYAHSVSSWSPVERISRGDYIWAVLHRDLNNIIAVSEGGMAYPLSDPERQVQEWEYGRHGRRLLREDKLILSVGGPCRPPKVYRSVHSGKHGNPQRGLRGLLARGVEIDHSGRLTVVVPTYKECFQIQVERHFILGHPDWSPFMSATDDLGQAEKRCLKDEEEEHYQDIELLEIETTGPYWCHPVMSMFKATHLREAFGLDCNVGESEYLIQFAIPRQHVTRVSLQEVKRRIAYRYT